MVPLPGPALAHPPQPGRVEEAHRPLTHRLVIVGGGFGGLYAARALRRAAVEITLVDRRNYHLFQPLLYQVATGALSPANIAAPLRGVLSRQRNTRVWLADAVDLDPAARKLILRDGELPYDSLIVATGSRHHYFGNDAWEARAPGLKTLDDATAIRRRILSAFEQAERDPVRARGLMTMVVVGGGPTGVEMAGAMSEIAKVTLRHDFRAIDPSQARIVLLEGGDRVLGAYVESLSAEAERALVRLGVEVRTRTQVIDVLPGAVVVKRDGASERIDAHTVIWAAGVRASRFGDVLQKRAGAALDRAGRVMVQPDLTVAGHPEIFVIGDLAHLDQDGKPLPGIAPVAMQQGRYVARLIQARAGGETVAPRPFRYRDKGTMATIGRGKAVADIKGMRFSGLFAWLTWLFVHLMYLVQFSNRLLVLFQWAWNYVTFRRSARLITGTDEGGATP